MFIFVHRACTSPEWLFSTYFIEFSVTVEVTYKNFLDYNKVSRDYSQTSAQFLLSNITHTHYNGPSIPDT